MVSNFSANNNNIPDLYQWQGRVTQRRNAIADSDASSDHDRDLLLGNEHRETDLTSFCKNCCTCKTRRRPRIRSKVESLLISSSEFRTTHKSASYREQLEMKVLNDEITVQEISEKQKYVKDQVESITEIMRTLSMYAHCLEMRHNIAIRLQRLINQIVPRKEYNSNESFKWGSVSKSLNDIYHICSENSDLPTVYFDNLEDHFEKQNDFSKASTNFCRVLQQQTDLSNNQLRKLELQYDEIKLQYKNSSTSIDSHLNEIIDTRASVAEKCLQNMAPILQCTIEEERSMWRFLKEITFSNINHQYQPDRVLSVKSLPEKLGAKSNEEKPILCTCPPSNFFQKSGIGYKMN